MIYDINGNELTDSSLNKLIYKKLSAIGDSYVSGTNEQSASDMWWYKIADRNDMTSQNLGLGSESLRSMVQNQRYTQIASDADYIVVFTGHNDVHYDYTPVGTETDTGSTTFYGCMDILCKWIMNNRPLARTLFITPTHRSEYDATPYVEAMKNVCYRYGIPCWDAYGNLGILIGGQEGVDQREIFETHNLRYHLNALGQTYLSYKIEAELARL